MNKIDYLIEYLLKERGEEKDLSKVEDKKSLYKALCNIREAKPISEEYIKVENDYLQEELQKKGIVSIQDIGNTNILLWQGDITRLKVDCIVNPANSEGLGCFNPTHKCLDNIIGTNAGVSLRLECWEVMKTKNNYLAPGDCMITKGYNLPSKYVIHTVGPMIQHTVTEKDRNTLRNCYYNSLELAHQNHLKTIAFPCIATGLFGYPKEEASLIAIQTIKDYIQKYPNNFDTIIFNVFTEEDLEIYQKNLKVGDSNDRY